MRLRPARLVSCLVLAFAAMGAHAQSQPVGDSAVLPVWNHATGKVEALLLLEPAKEANIGARLRFSERALDATFGLNAGDSLGLLCDRKAGVDSAIGSLANHCMLAALGDEGTRRASLGLVASRPGGRIGFSLGKIEDTLPAWLSPNAAARVEQNDLTVYGRKDIGREGFVTIGGTVAKARLVPAADAPLLAGRWNARSISLGGGVGAFSGNIVGRVVDVPGQQSDWQGLGLGLTWRTPWSGQLTVGADNIVTRGKNPFSIPADAQDTGAVPYVRYEQDL